MPESALAWYLDQVYVYSKAKLKVFSRQPLTAYSVASKGYFVTEAIAPGAEIVSTGEAQLLSEELKQQIHDED